MSALLWAGLLALGQAPSEDAGPRTESVTEAPDTSRSDLAERLIVRLGVSFDPVFGSALSDDANLRLDNAPLIGTAALGTRRLLLPMLNTYALAQGVLELQGAPTISLALDPNAERPIHPSVYHAYPEARAFLLHLAYAELEGLSTEGLLSKLHLRGGRQFHFGLVGVTFDGGTLGFDSRRLSVAVRGGQRSAVFDRSGDDPDRSSSRPGLVLGGSARYRVLDGDVTLDVRGEFLHFERTLGLSLRDRPLEAPGVTSVDRASDLGEVVVDLVAGDDVLVTARGSLVGPELSHLRVGVTYPIGRTVLLLDYDQKVGPDLLYDLATGGGIERRGRRTTYETFRLNIPDPQPYADVRGAILFDVGEWLEIEPSGGVRMVLADDVDRSPYDASRVVWGLGANARLPAGSRAGVEIYGDYTAVLYLRPDPASGNFRDAVAGAESMSHDVTAGVRYVRRGDYSLAPVDGRLLSHRTFSAGLYGFFASSRFETRYVLSPLDQVTAGGGADVRVDLARTLTLSLAYEMARGPSTLGDDLGLFYGFRGGIQAQF